MSLSKEGYHAQCRRSLSLQYNARQCAINGEIWIVREITLSHEWEKTLTETVTLSKFMSTTLFMVTLTSKKARKVTV
jgi:hypothetical protein